MKAPAHLEATRSNSQQLQIRGIHTPLHHNGVARRLRSELSSVTQIGCPSGGCPGSSSIGSASFAIALKHSALSSGLPVHFASAAHRADAAATERQ